MTWHINLALLVILIAAPGVGTGVACGQDETPRMPQESDGRLQWVYSPGQVLIVDTTLSADTSMDFGNRKIDSFSQLTMEVRMKIDSVDSDGIGTATSLIDRLQLAVEAPGLHVKYDTASPGNPAGAAAELAQLLAPIIGADLKQKLAPSGKILDVSIPEQMMSGLAGADPALASLFSRDSIKNLVSQSAVAFPESAPEVGFKWDERREIQMGPNRTVTDTAYIYVGVVDVDRRPLHLIRAVIRMSYPDGLNGADVEITEEDSRARFYFDGVAGRMVKSEMNQDISMTLTLNGQTARAMQQQTLTVEIREGQ